MSEENHNLISIRKSSFIGLFVIVFFLSIFFGFLFQKTDFFQAYLLNECDQNRYIFKRQLMEIKDNIESVSIQNDVEILENELREITSLIDKTINNY